MPRRNRTSMEAPAAKGVPKVTAPADRVELKPPPLGCEGGCSSVVPSTVTLLVPAPHGARSTVTTTLEDVRGRRSAVPDGAGNVVRSMILNRSRVRSPPLVLVKVRRTSSVPKVELLAGSLVKSRTELGGGGGWAPEPLSCACRGAVGVYKIEIDGIVVGVQRHAGRQAGGEGRDRALFSTDVAGERVVDGEGCQGRITSALLVQRIGFGSRAHGIQPVGQQELGGGIAAEQRDPCIVRNVRDVGGIACGCRAIASGVGADGVGHAVDAQVVPVGRDDGAVGDGTPQRAIRSCYAVPSAGTGGDHGEW